MFNPQQQQQDISKILSYELIFDGELETLEWIGKDDEILLNPPLPDSSCMYGCDRRCCWDEFA